MNFFKFFFQNPSISLNIRCIHRSGLLKASIRNFTNVIRGTDILDRCVSSFGNMDMGFSGGGRSVSVETTTINGRTIEKTTVVENGVTTVTTKEL